MIRSLMAALASIVLAATALVAFAQEGPSLQQKYEEKVAESWFKDNGFSDDFDAVRAKAKETGKPIFAYFTRSYAG